jgi:hypothetical protein
VRAVQPQLTAGVSDAGDVEPGIDARKNPAPDAVALLTSVEEHRVTESPGHRVIDILLVPTMIQLVVDHPQTDAFDLVQHPAGPVGRLPHDRIKDMIITGGGERGLRPGGEKGLPLSAAGRVLKRELRKPYWEGHERAVN